MNKGLPLIVAMLFYCGMNDTIAQNDYAAVVTDSISDGAIDEDNADFTFTESQLDDDKDAAQTVSTVMSTNNDPFMSRVGFLFSAVRFKVRAYDNQYSQTYVNGLLMNDMERGFFSYGMIGGLNDATRNKEGVTCFEDNRFGYVGIGGGDNINTRASQYAAGNKLSFAACNRNYKARLMYTTATGIMSNGWALAGSVGYRWANEGVIEGTFYNSFSYFLSAQKIFNQEHSLSIVTFGAPTERAQQGASTEEAYWLANSHYYNPNWGYQDGKKRNARIVNDYEPTALVTWDWNVDADRKLVSTAGFKYAMYSSSALGWCGDAYDPRPDYYKNLPSSVFNVYDEKENSEQNLYEQEYFVDQWNRLYDYWTSNKANRQINWDRMYYVNRHSESIGGEALYYQEKRHNDQIVVAFSTVWNHVLNANNKYTVGAYLNKTKGMHYKTMADLLGASKYTDLDKFAINDYGLGSDEAQNDLRHPNRKIGVGDRFGYDYDINVEKARIWGLYQFVYGPMRINASAYGEGTIMSRYGNMQNGRAPKNSFGASENRKFTGGGIKAVFVVRPFANQFITVAGGYEALAPHARNSFLAMTLRNDFVDNLELEKVLSGEVAYVFRFGDVTGKVDGYYTGMSDQVDQTAFYNDQQSTFTYLTMSGIEKCHYGLEVAVNYQVNSNLSFHALASYGNAKYTNNPKAQVSYEGMDEVEVKELNSYTNPLGEEEELRVIANGMKVSGTPLAGYNIGAKYSIKNWFFEANLNYFDRIYLGFSPYRRLASTYKTGGKIYTPSSFDTEGNRVYNVTYEELKRDGGILYDLNGKYVKGFAAQQEKFDAGFMLDASVGRFIRLKHGKTLSINLSVSNITNNTNLKTGGYEQNRDDFYYSESNGVYSKGESKTYQFSKNAKYYYANSINAFLNVGFKF